MVNFPPLMPSASWLGHYLKAIANDASESQAIHIANESLVSTREFGRYVLFDPRGERVTLSLAVNGGGRQLRYPEKLTCITLSEHGDWRRNHLKALEACLGKKPFFNDLFPSLSELYLNKELLTLEDFNTTLLKFLFTFIVGKINKTEISRYFKNETWIQRGQEIASRIKPEVSSIEVASAFGKESLLGFLALN
ncbi:MAG: WbqC family protein [Muribaculaceae bacterium]|nr:WbqC family protein [Muribaculaceae bacterium]